jgi:hypothetical protein
MRMQEFRQRPYWREEKRDHLFVRFFPVAMQSSFLTICAFYPYLLSISPHPRYIYVHGDSKAHQA